MLLGQQVHKNLIQNFCHSVYQINQEGARCSIFSDYLSIVRLYLYNAKKCRGVAKYMIPRNYIGYTKSPMCIIHKIVFNMGNPKRNSNAESEMDGVAHFISRCHESILGNNIPQGVVFDWLICLLVALWVFSSLTLLLDWPRKLFYWRQPYCVELQHLYTFIIAINFQNKLENLISHIFSKHLFLRLLEKSYMRKKFLEVLHQKINTNEQQNSLEFKSKQKRLQEDVRYNKIFILWENQIKTTDSRIFKT